MVGGCKVGRVLRALLIWVARYLCFSGAIGYTGTIDSRYSSNVTSYSAPTGTRAHSWRVSMQSVGSQCSWIVLATCNLYFQPFVDCPTMLFTLFQTYIWYKYASIGVSSHCPVGKQLLCTIQPLLSNIDHMLYCHSLRCSCILRSLRYYVSLYFKQAYINEQQPMLDARGYHLYYKLCNPHIGALLYIPCEAICSTYFYNRQNNIPVQCIKFQYYVQQGSILLLLHCQAARLWEQDKRKGVRYRISTIINSAIDSQQTPSAYQQAIRNVQAR